MSPPAPQASAFERGSLSVGVVLFAFIFLKEGALLFHTCISLRVPLVAASVYTVSSQTSSQTG